MNPNELIHRYFLGIATAVEVRELEDRLRNEETLQDEYLLHAEIDADLRQAAQSLATNDMQLPSARIQPSPKLWKWLSGISTLAATILLGILILNFPPQKKALAYPSLGEFHLHLSWSDQNIWSAAGAGNLANMRLELERKTSVDTRMNDGLTPLHVAALFGRQAAVELLLSEGADVSLTEDEGNTALHMAAFLGNTSIVRDLITAGADPAKRNKLGFNALDLVDVTWSSGLEAYYHRTEQILGTTLDLEKIRTERPKISTFLSAADSTEIDSRPTISLWQAAMTGNTAAIKQHIAAGTELNAQEDFGGSTPLILTAIFGQPEAAKILIDAGADLEKRNKSGGTALHLASFFCQPEVIQMLLQAGADPSKTNNDQLTPLGVATIEFTSELEFGYRYVYESLGIECDLEHIKKTRRIVALLLQEHLPNSNEKLQNANEESTQ